MDVIAIEALIIEEEISMLLRRRAKVEQQEIVPISFILCMRKAKHDEY